MTRSRAWTSIIMYAATSIQVVLEFVNRQVAAFPACILSILPILLFPHLSYSFTEVLISRMNQWSIRTYDGEGCPV